MRLRRFTFALIVAHVTAAAIGCGPAKEVRDPETVEHQSLLDLLPFATIVSEGGQSAPEPISGDDAFFLPYGVSVEFFLDLPARTELSFGLRIPDRGRGRLEVTRATDADDEQILASADRTEERLTASLTESADAVRITFAAIGEDGSDSQGVLVRHASILIPKEADQPLPSARSASPAVRLPSIVIFLVDTLRPDHLGAYGYPRPVSPHLDRFAKQATLFEYAVGQSSWTKPSVASLFTGRWPLSHGAVGRKDRLPAEQTVLAEILGEAGYRTGAVLTNPNVSSAFGFDQGFDHVVELQEDTSSANAVRHATAWIDSPGDDRPFFLYVHTQDPHSPYLPPDEFREKLAQESDGAYARILERPRKETWGRDLNLRDQLLALYDAEIAANDQSFGQLLEHLGPELYDSSMIVFVSDHGEEFLEHNRWGHGRNLHSSQLNVALLIKRPGQSSPIRVTEPAQHADLLPTIIGVLGLPPREHLEGRDLSPFLDGRITGVGSRDRVFAHLYFGGQTALVTSSYKLIQRRQKGLVTQTWLFDWRNDSRESDNLAEHRPILAAALAAEMRKKMSQRASSEPVALDPRLEERLRALGYLD